MAGTRAHQAAGLVEAHRAHGALLLHVAREQGQDLAKGQVGVAAAGVGVAQAAGHHQLGVRVHGAPGELAQEHGLAAARVAHHEPHAPLALQRPRQPAVQLRQLLLASHEEGTRRPFASCSGAGLGDGETRGPRRRQSHDLVLGDAPSRPWRIASYSAVVSGAGSTSSSSASTRRQASYCASAALRSPAQRQGAHQLPLPLLSRGLQRHLAPRVGCIAA